MNVEEYFLKLRFDKSHHLGVGDIRLTLGQQDELIAAFKQRQGLPSGWIAVPVTPTIAMHNAAALGDIYTPPTITYDEYSGNLRLHHGAPDWSRAWRLMVEAAPSLRCEVERNGEAG